MEKFLSRRGFIKLAVLSGAEALLSSVPPANPEDGHSQPEKLRTVQDILTIYKDIQSKSPMVLASNDKREVTKANESIWWPRTTRTEHWNGISEGQLPVMDSAVAVTNGKGMFVSVLGLNEPTGSYAWWGVNANEGLVKGAEMPRVINNHPVAAIIPVETDIDGQVSVIVSVADNNAPAGTGLKLANLVIENGSYAFADVFDITQGLNEGPEAHNYPVDLSPMCFLRVPGNPSKRLVAYNRKGYENGRSSWWMSVALVDVESRTFTSADVAELPGEPLVIKPMPCELKIRPDGSFDFAVINRTNPIANEGDIYKANISFDGSGGLTVNRDDNIYPYLDKVDDSTILNGHLYTFLANGRSLRVRALETGSLTQVLDLGAMDMQATSISTVLERGLVARVVVKESEARTMRIDPANGRFQFEGDSSLYIRSATTSTKSEVVVVDRTSPTDLRMSLIDYGTETSVLLPSVGK